MSFNVWSMGLFLRELEALEVARSLAAAHLHQVANQTSGEPPAKSTLGSQKCSANNRSLPSLLKYPLALSVVPVLFLFIN